MEMGARKVEIITRETIKPSSPTPPHQRNLKLSMLDQHAVASYTPILLFYPNPLHDDDPKVKLAERSERLKQSLSKSLTCFYPLAGRIKANNMLIDCNDEGVEYLEARVLNFRLSCFLEQPEAKLLNTLLPVDIESTEAAANSIYTGHVCLVQTSFFECGGMSIGISISHKIIDAASLAAFIKAWASTALALYNNNDHDQKLVLLPQFNASSLFPPLDFSMTGPEVKMFKSENVITRRYVFDGSKIDLLKAKVVTTEHPTRVEVVSALIWKCAMSASMSNLRVNGRPSAMSQTVNMRKIIVNGPAEQKLDHLFGNAIGLFVAEAESGELDGLVGQLRKGKEKFCDEYGTKALGKEGGLMICEVFKEAGYMCTRDDFDLYLCTSWCRFPLYDADFGWGRPMWVSIASSAFKNAILLMDTRDGRGIEAWVNLTEQDMALFQRDQELLSFASFNPTVSLN